MSILDLTGKKFGRLTVVGRAPKLQSSPAVRWNVKCDCGIEKVVNSQKLRLGETRSCGCLKRDTMSRVMKAYHTTHGGSYTKLYNIWHSMRKRCLCKTDKNFSGYGGRGIKICARWEDFSKFRDDMGFPPKGMLLDRINNDGNYEPSNCRWTDAKTSSNNRRSRYRNVKA